ncbi:MAG: hypothetical protein ACLTZY_09545 [Alistipes indistinctus]
MFCSADKARKLPRPAKPRHFDLISFLDNGNRLLVSSGFAGIDSCTSTLLDSLSSAANIYVSSRNSFDMMEADPASGKYDYLICEMSEAQLGCALVRRRRAGRILSTNRSR